jgi:hypothetical protein
MGQDQAINTTTQAAAPSTQAATLLSQTLDDVFAADDPLPYIDQLIIQLDPVALGDLLTEFQLVLESLGSFFLGLKVMEAVRFVEARDHLQRASQGFSQTGLEELRDLAIGFGTYAEAIIELQAYNVGKAQEIFAETREYLRKAGKFGQRFAPIIDHMHPDQLYVQGVQALMTRDLGTAKTLIEQASDAAEKVAHTYYEPESPDHFSFLGFAHFYKAYYTFVQAFNDFNEFKYDNLAKEINLKADALQAKEFLGKGNHENVFVRYLICLTNGIIELLDVIVRLSALLRDVLDSNYRPDPLVYDTLRQGIRRASNDFSQAGQQAAVILRFCDQLFSQVANLERLAKPRNPESPRETAARESFAKFQEAALESLSEPLRQLGTWSILTTALVALSVVLILVGAVGALFVNTQVGVLTSVSSLVTSIVSSVLFFELRRARVEVKESRRDILKQLKEASERFFSR